MEKWLKSEVVGGDGNEGYRMWLVGRGEEEFERWKEDLRRERKEDIEEVMEVGGSNGEC